MVSPFVMQVVPIIRFMQYLDDWYKRGGERFLSITGVIPYSLSRQSELCSLSRQSELWCGYPNWADNQCWSVDILYWTSR